MKPILIISFSIIFFAGTAYSYPESQMNDCITSALSNPATKSISEDSIKSYCSCFLNAVVDKGKDLRETSYECAQKTFK